jgi:hypothetical protein
MPKDSDTVNYTEISWNGLPINGYKSKNIRRRHYDSYIETEIKEWTNSEVRWVNKQVSGKDRVIIWNVKLSHKGEWNVGPEMWDTGGKAWRRQDSARLCAKD